MCLVRGRHFFLEARRRLPAGSTLASQTRALLLARRGGGSADAFPGVPGAGSFVDKGHSTDYLLKIGSRSYHEKLR